MNDNKVPQLQCDMIARLSELLSIESDENFFSQLAIKSSELLKADYVFIGELVSSRRDEVKTRGFAVDGAVAENISYPLAGTPCEQILERSACVYRSDVQNLFPEDMDLVEMGAEGYAGIPLRSVTGEVLGLFAVLYRTPIEDPLQLQHLLKIISVRISNELERIKDNEILKVKTSDLLLQNTRIEALYKLSQMDPSDTQAIKEFALDAAMQITQSEIGYIFLLNEDETILSLHVWSDSVMEKCKIVEPQTEFKVSDTGLWGEAVRQRKPIITNDYSLPSPHKKGVPEGHVPILRHLNLPIIDQGKVVLVAGVSNKTEPYDDDDVRHLTLLMDGLWQALINNHYINVLQESEQSFRRFYENSPLSYQSLDGHGCFIDVNPAWESTFGYSRDEVIGKSFGDLMTERSSSLVSERFPVLKERGVVHDADFELLHKDGHVVDIVLHGRSSYDQWGNFLKTNCILIDVTEARRAEEKLRQSAAENKQLSFQLQQLLDSIPDRILFLDPDLKIVWTNQTNTPLGDSFESIPKGEYCFSLMQDRSEPCPDCPALIALDTGKITSRERSNEDGRIWHQRAFPIIDVQGNVVNVVEIGQDITEKLQLQKELMHKGQLAALGELAAGVAHEINNPINGVINYAQILKNRSATDSDNHNILDGIIKEGDRIARIVSQLLFLSRVDKEKPQPVNLTEIITDVLGLVGSQFYNEGIDVEISVDENLPMIKGHAQQLEQLFLNVLSNARYALNQCYVDNNPNKRLQVSVQFDATGQNLVAKVCDHGTGIPEEARDKVMQPFYTSKPSSEGTGLGLSISNDIVKNHGGTMEINSEEGCYTEVCVAFPIQKFPEQVYRASARTPAKT